MNPITPLRCISLAGAVALACVAGPAHSEERHDRALTEALRRNLDTIVVIYAENRAFDNLYGHFPGARGLGEVVDRFGRTRPAYVAQKDRDGSVLATLPQTWGGVTAAGVTPVITQAASGGLPNAPFEIETAFTPASAFELSSSTVTRDLYHRFFENQMQINGGKNDGFAAWADAGGLTMGHFDYAGSRLYALARRYTLADNFCAGVFGGSFLNHQYLICACAPVYPSADAPASGAHPTIAILDTDATGAYLPHLTTKATSPASALDGAAAFVLSGNIAPFDYFGDGQYHAINTMQAPYQPSGNAPVDATAASLPYARPAAATTLPPQTQTTIGDLLNRRGVAWKWYAGSWNAALADGMHPPTAARTVIYTPSTPRGNPGFQPHHAPFNYYAGFDPVTHASERTQHLKDYDDLVADAAAGKLPAVAFYKPQGNFNQHEGYANLDDGDAHIAGLIEQLKESPQWQHMLIVVTYDEFGGVWDHVPPPAGDRLGPGTRIPALLISRFAKRGFVDHTQYDTASVLRLITRRFDLPTLPGLESRDRALRRNGERPMGDLTNALDLGRDRN